MVALRDALVFSPTSPMRDILANYRSYGEIWVTDKRASYQRLWTHDIANSGFSLSAQISMLRRFDKLVAYADEQRPAIAEYFASLTRQAYSDMRYTTGHKYEIQHAGLKVKIDESNLDDTYGILPATFKQMFPNINLDEDGYMHYIIDAARGSGLLADAYNEATVSNLRAQQLSAEYKRDVGKITVSWRTVYKRWYNEEGSSRVLAYGVANYRLAKFLADFQYKPDAATVWKFRRNLLDSQQAAAQLADTRKTLDKFTQYWDSFKIAARTKARSTDSSIAWASIPLQEPKTKSSRTWGIEVEVVQDSLVNGTPSGWDCKADGSLSPVSNSCDCDCDDCGDDCHCGYDNCYVADDECAEYVSPILRSFNSNGLKQLCDDLGGSAVNETPGIHVHVGAGDLSVADVARLTVAYSAVSPYLESIIHRQSRGYCKDVSSNNVRFWLASSRDMRKSMVSTPATDVVYSQPDDRYHDLNLQALNAHGTIEFRAMGPFYNYDHLIRWAWFCREMVNVSRLDLPQSTWTSVSSMQDVIDILIAHGSESTPEMVASAIEE